MRTKSLFMLALLAISLRCDDAEAGEADPQPPVGQPDPADSQEQTDSEETAPPKKDSPLHLCISNDRGLCLLHPQKVDQFIGNRECVVIMITNDLQPYQAKLFRKTYNRLQSIPSECYMAWVDPSLDPKFVEEADYFPTELFTLFNAGEHKEYTGKLNPLALFRWVVKSTFDIVHKINTPGELDGFHELKAYVILVNTKDEEELNSKYHKVSKQIQDMNFVRTKSPQVGNEFGVGEEPKVVLVTNFDKSYQTLDLEDGRLSKRKLVEFLNSKRRTDVRVGDSQTVDHMLNWREPVVIRVSKDGEGTKFRDFARRFNGILNPDENPDSRQVLDKLLPKGFIVEGFWPNFVEVNRTDPFASWLVRWAGRNETASPPDEDWIMILKRETEELQRFYLPEWTMESLKKALLDLESGTLQPHYRGADEAPQDNLPVIGLTKQTLQDEIIEHDRSALLFIYSPGCGFCTRLAPVMKQLAEDYAEVENFGVFEIDGMANDHPSFYTESFPTILFYSGKNKMDPQVVEKHSEYSEIAEFLASKGIVSNKAKIGEEL